LAFTLGALLPLLAIMMSPQPLRLPVTVVAVLLALAAAGAASARIGGSPPRVAVLRIVIGGAVGLAFTYAVGRFFGMAIG
jgi:VIT1/CCC1 family predicted Fe2+/Mn2+ transporter